MQSRNRNLILVRCGDESIHPSWLPGAGEERNWDLIANYFGDAESCFRCSDYIRIDSKGPKYSALFDLLSSNPELLLGYDYVWLPDDDLRLSCSEANAFFNLCRKHRLSIAQPSLSSNSHAVLPITLHNSLFEVRFTSFVEVMAPCFEVAVLEKVLPTFQSSQTGCGLDFVWPFLIGEDALRMGIVDAVQVEHTRPPGGPNHQVLRAKGMDAQDEIDRVLAVFNIKQRHYYVFGGVIRGGGRKATTPRILFQFLLCAGSIVSYWNADKWTARYKFRAVLGLLRWQSIAPKLRSSEKGIKSPGGSVH